MVQHAVLDQILPLTIRPMFQLAIDAGLNAYASLLGFLEASASDFAGEIPLILKLNAHDLLHEEKDPLGALTASVSDARVWAFSPVAQSKARSPFGRSARGPRRRRIRLNYRAEFFPARQSGRFEPPRWDGPYLPKFKIRSK